VLLMEPESAEMTKYTANCFLAMKISFINEIASLCEKIGADIEEVREGICSDHRIGREFLKPGAGYGGSCFPKDVRALVSQAEGVNGNVQMLKTIDEVNERQKEVIPTKVLEHFDGDLTGKRIAVWGLAFKPGTDDIREAPALTLIQSLLDAGAKVAVHDPEATENVKELFDDQLEYCDEKYDAVRRADALVVMTDWAEYVGADPGVLRWHMKSPVVFDGRNCFNRDWFALASFDLYRIGQAPLERSKSWFKPVKLIQSPTPVNPAEATSTDEDKTERYIDIEVKSPRFTIPDLLSA
jgi:UDPglucose 6-dehydrogenase